MKRSATVIFFFQACIAVQITAAQDINPSLETAIDSIVINQQDVYELPGVAVGVLKNDQVIYAKAFGVERLQTGKPLSLRSDFHMASVSKPFAAAAIMQLAENGKIALDSPLVKYLPQFHMKDSAYRSITIFHILTHTSGIPNVKDYEWEKPQFDDSAAIRYAASFGDQVLDFLPGKQFKYSNAAFDLLPSVIAHVSGTTFEQYVATHIFEPAGMKNSTFLKPTHADMAMPHVLNSELVLHESPIYPYNRRHAASSTLHSNVEDMLLWGRIWINNGYIGSKKILSEKIVNGMLAPQFPAGNADSICLSWFKATLGHRKLFLHSGGDVGFRTFFAFDPESKTAVVVLANREPFPARNLALKIWESVVLGKPAERERKPIHLVLKNYILTDGIDKMKEVFWKEKQDRPSYYSFDSKYINDLGYLLLHGGHYEKAIDVFLFNVELEPRNATWYDSVGDGYLAQGKKQNAKEWFQKALALNPEMKETKEKLEKLK